MRSSLACTLLLIAFAAAVGVPPASAQEAAPGGVPAQALEREMLVRFSRAYGMAKGAMVEHGLSTSTPEGDAELLRNPEQLQQPLRDEVYDIMDLNRVEPEEWEKMFERMEEDAELHQRIESLSTPFGY
ncbi:MAG: hypothetical protein ACNA7W_20400 [Pseudomonadales bacterium]